MRKALILAGWYQDIHANWYEWLKNELEQRNYQVFLPDIPTMHTDLPDMKQQLAYIECALEIDNETIVIGHSIGALLALRLGETHAFTAMFLVAGWDFNDLTEEHRLFWQNKIDHNAIRSNVQEIYCISSDNDPYMTAFTVEAMCKRLGGQFVLLQGRGHFTEQYGVKEIPELLIYM